MNESQTYHHRQRAWLGLWALLALAGLTTLLVAATPATQPTSEPTSNLDYWLTRAETPTTQTTTRPAVTKKPLREFFRDDALPGVLELSDGRQIAGGVFTTRDKPWIVWIEKAKRWRRIPPAACLSITAKVIEEKQELIWRWKAMGEPEKVYTGEKYPFRRFLWTFRLADGTKITGAVKGQPLWIETPHKTHGPFLLPERSKGKKGQPLKNLIYIKQIVLSRKMMEKVNNTSPH